MKPASFASPGPVNLDRDFTHAGSTLTGVAARTPALSPIHDMLIEGFNHYACSDYFRLERLPGGVCTD
jgi:hypothetical protein